VNTHMLSVEKLNDAAATVFVVDDDLSVREAIAGLLASVGVRVRLFASAADLIAHIEAFDADSPDLPNCLIVDVRMPGVGGLELQQHLVRSSTKFPIIFVSGHGDVAMTVQAMKAGARDFLSKPFRDQDMLDAVRSALLHDRAHREVESMKRDLRGRYESLTTREQTLLTLIARGLMNKQIASEMCLSEISIKVHRRRLMSKMNAKSFAELVKMEERIQTCNLRSE
jgi:FixJ family two-component response regulator